MSKFLYSRNKSNISTSPLISFTYFFKERALGCLSSRFSYLNFKECALRCWSSRFSCALSSNSNKLFGLWTWSVVNGQNASIFDHLMPVGFFVLCLLLWVAIQYLLSCIWFIFGFLTLLSLSYLKKYIYTLTSSHVFLHSYYFVHNSY